MIANISKIKLSEDRKQKPNNRNHVSSFLSSLVCLLSSINSIERFKKGFTLVEVMVATVVLAIGVVIIFEGFILSIDAVNFFNNRLNAQWFLNEKIWHVQDMLDQPAAAFVPMHERGLVNLGKRVCKWETHLLIKDAAQELYLLRATLKWSQGNKEMSVSRQTLVKRYFNNSAP